MVNPLRLIPTKVKLQNRKDLNYYRLERSSWCSFRIQPIIFDGSPILHLLGSWNRFVVGLAIEIRRRKTKGIPRPALKGHTEWIHIDLLRLILIFLWYALLPRQPTINTDACSKLLAAFLLSHVPHFPPWLGHLLAENSHPTFRHQRQSQSLETSLRTPIPASRSAPVQS